MKNGCFDSNWQVSAWPGRSTSIGKKAAWHCRSIRHNLGSSCLAIDSSKTTSSMVPSGCCKPCLRREIASSLTAAGLTPQGRLRSIVDKWTAILLKPTACSCLSLPSLVYAKSAEDIAACQALHLRVDSNFSSVWRKAYHSTCIFCQHWKLLILPNWQVMLNAFKCAPWWSRSLWSLSQSNKLHLAGLPSHTSPTG